MKFRILTLEREYGTGGPHIAELLAKRLGWKLWDQELSARINQLVSAAPPDKAPLVQPSDALVSRLFRAFARGSYERSLPSIEGQQVLNPERMACILQQVVEGATASGNCVIVGRGSTFFLRDRQDAFHVFIYASEAEKIRRLRASGKSEREATDLAVNIDRDRAYFIQRYFGKEWPHRPLYHLMVNSVSGDELVVKIILDAMAAIEADSTSQ